MSKPIQNDSSPALAQIGAWASPSTRPPRLTVPNAADDIVLESHPEGSTALHSKYATLPETTTTLPFLIHVEKGVDDFRAAVPVQRDEAGWSTRATCASYVGR
jgi:hypothetical protein